MLSLKARPFGMSATALELLASFALASCGGQTDSSTTALDNGGHASLTNTGGATSIAGSNPLGSGGTFDVVWKPDASTQTDASSTCSMPASDYDDTCVTDADCTEVPGGNPCGNTCQCLIGMNVRVAAKYMADYEAILRAEGHVGVCACPCLGALCCSQGHCQNSCSACN